MSAREEIQRSIVRQMIQGRLDEAAANRLARETSTRLQAGRGDPSRPASGTSASMPCAPVAGAPVQATALGRTAGPGAASS